MSGTTEQLQLSQDAVGELTRAYVETHHGPHGDAPADTAVTAPIERGAAAKVTPDLLAAHTRLGRRRAPGDTLVAVYPAEDPGGFGPAIQVVTDYSAMLMDSVTVLLHRFGVPYSWVMNPVLRAGRDAGGELRALVPASDPDAPDGADEMWIHVQLSSTADSAAVAEVADLLPSVLADARQVAADSAALNATLIGLANALDSDHAGHFPGPDRRDVAALLHWLGDGHFVLMGYQRCAVHNGQATVDTASRLGVLKLRTDVLPQLTEADDLLVLAQATMPSFLRYGAYPYIVVVREKPAGPASNQAVEHRFVGLFTASAMNANVLDIPLISRRVDEAMAQSHSDPSHPAQLMLDVIQTIPRSELFALRTPELLEMARAVVDLGSLRRTLLFLRADQLGHFVSALVYLPRDRYTTAVRLEMQKILVRELGGTSIEYAARVSESPWAVVHFTVKMPDTAQRADVDTSADNEVRIQHLLTEAARTWADRLIGSAKTESLSAADAEYYSSAFPEIYKQAFTPQDAIEDIAIIEQLQDNSVKLVFRDGGSDRVDLLTWYLGAGRPRCRSCCRCCSPWVWWCWRNGPSPSPGPTGCRCGSTSSRCHRTSPFRAPPPPTSRTWPPGSPIR